MNGKAFFWTVLLCVASWIVLGAVVVEHLHTRDELARIKANAKADLDACHAEVADMARQRDEVSEALRTATEKTAFWQAEAGRLQAELDAKPVEARAANWQDEAIGLVGMLFGGAVLALGFGALRAGYEIQAPVVRRQRDSARASGHEIVKW